MTKETERNKSGHVSFAFNATRMMADPEQVIPWKRAHLIARAEREYRRLHGLRPAKRPD